MQWWTWFVLGTLLLAIELFAIDAQFFLIFIGAAAIVVGLIGMLGINLPVWLQWLLFAALAVAAVVTMRKQIYAKLRNRPHPGSTVTFTSSCDSLRCSNPGSRPASSTAARRGLR